MFSGLHTKTSIQLTLGICYAGAKRRNTTPPRELDSLVQAMFETAPVPNPCPQPGHQALAVASQPLAQNVNILNVERYVFSFLAKMRALAARRRQMRTGYLASVDTRMEQRFRLRSCLAMWTPRELPLSFIHTAIEMSTCAKAWATSASSIHCTVQISTRLNWFETVGFLYVPG